MPTPSDAQAQDTQQTSDKISMCPVCGVQALKAGYGCTVCDYLVQEIADDKPLTRVHALATKLMQAKHEAAANEATWRETLRIERDCHINAERLKLEYRACLENLQAAVNKFTEGEMAPADLIELAVAVRLL